MKIIATVLILCMIFGSGCITKEAFVPAGDISTDKSSYEHDEVITISWDDINFVGRIDVFDSDNAHVVTYMYAYGRESGSFNYTINDDNAPGTWNVVLMFGHETIDQKSFTVNNQH